MKEVMQKAQDLATAIADSAIYRKMKELEEEIRRDPEANDVLADMIQKRQRVEEILSDVHMNPDDLSKASLEMEAAEKRMNDNPRIQKLKETRKDFQTMMDNVNKILRLVITGEVAEEDEKRGCCQGDCSACGGCR